MSLIELRNLERTYFNGIQPLHVLKGVSLTIKSGEMVAIIGPSGSGKSTLMNIIGCLDKADAGDYFFREYNVAHLSPDALAKLRREHIGFIFQRYHLIPDIDVLANVEIPAIYAGIHHRMRRSRALRLLSRLGLQGREHHKPGKLSGGQQQRVSIARALMNGAKVILADEPTGALDSHSGDEVLHILSELNRDGHTVILVTHDMKVAKHAQRIIEIQDGEIVSDKSMRAPFFESTDKLLALHSGWKWSVYFDRIRESFRMALTAMNAHRLRSALTMIGIIFGIAAVVTVVALGEGAKKSTLDNIQSLGTNLVTIYAGDDFIQDDNHTVKTLVMDDADIIKRQYFVQSVSPEMISSQPVRYLSKSSKATVLGVGSDYFAIHGLTMSAGRIFSDDIHARQEVIIDENTRKILFDSQKENPINRIIILGAVPVRIVGIAHNDSNSPPNRLTVWMPWSSVMYRMSGNTALSSISIRLKEDVASGPAANLLSQMIASRHGQKDFMIFNLDKYRKAFEHASTTMTLLILMVAFIALMIGSLGVMNIMLVSVTERTHEIGVRMALGARRSDIMQQFMIEAVLICLIGGIFGIGLSISIGPVLTLMGRGVLTAIYSWQAALVAFSCSTFIGMIFGYLPARKAARMDPAAALVSE